MDLDDVARAAERLDGVRRVERNGRAEWRYHGRLVARELDEAHVVIRTGFSARDALVRESPTTFSVPRRFAKHTMVVADLQHGDRAAVEDALDAAWELQRSAD